MIYRLRMSAQHSILAFSLPNLHDQGAVCFFASDASLLCMALLTCGARAFEARLRLAEKGRIGIVDYYRPLAQGAIMAIIDIACWQALVGHTVLYSLSSGSFSRKQGMRSHLSKLIMGPVCLQYGKVRYGLPNFPTSSLTYHHNLTIIIFPHEHLPYFPPA